jgi:NAD(P)-dependent dehydrogenase (short-subunit alcohol dehydrogenase family)
MRNIQQEFTVDLGLRDKVTLVLGGGGGLGRAIATTLAAEGAKIAVADVSEVGGSIGRSASFAG